MADRVALSSLIAQFGSEARLDLTEHSFEPAVTVHPSPVPGYVWPDVELDETALAPVLLITSPGAMGKSAAAAAASHALHAPLVDLARLHVGSNSLTGLLTKTFGLQGAASLQEGLRAGTAHLVLDSLDEAQLRAGRDHFQAFLDDVADLMRDVAAPGRLLLFGRLDPIETAFLVLSTSGIEAQMVTIAPLSHTQACELLERQLEDRQPPYRVHVDHPVPFAAWRDSRFADLAKALDPNADIESPTAYWDEVSDFLGYPPVLLVLAQDLAVDNPSAELAKRKSAGTQFEGGSLRGELLQRVIEGLLDREAAKVRAQIGSELAINPEVVTLLYTREEQMLRVLRRATGVPQEIAPPAQVPSNRRERYEELISSFVLDHPFLRGDAIANVVFSDYLRAFVLTSPLLPFHGGSQAQWRLACGSPGPFFAHFVHSITSATTASDRGVASEELVDDLIRSNAAASDESMAVYLHMHEVAELDLIAAGRPDGDPAWFLRFDVVDPAGVVELTSPIARAVIMSAHGVRLAATADELEIGPDVFVAAESLEIAARRVVARGVEPGTRGVVVGDVYLTAASVGHDPGIRVSSFPDGALGISWPNPTFQWRSHAMSTPRLGDLVDPVRTQAVLQALRRLLVPFKGGGPAEAPRIYWERMDRVVVGDLPVVTMVHDALKALGVIRREGVNYVLILDRLAEFDVSYASLRGSDWNTALEPLLREVCKTPEVHRYIRLEPG